MLFIDDTTYDMEINIKPGDTTNDNVIDKIDVDNIGMCLGKKVITNPECTNMDINDDSEVDGLDLSIVNGGYEGYSDIKYIDTFSIKGRVSYIGDKPSIKIGEHTTIITDTGDFSFDNILKGFYPLEIKKRGYLSYKNCNMYLDDIDDLNIELIAGDLNNNDVTDQADVDEIQYTIDDIASGACTYEEYKHYDLNNDGVIDSNDKAIITANVGKTY